MSRCLLLVVLLIGCEKTSHESIDNWAGNDKGHAKLRNLVEDEGADPDFSAHAAANLIKLPMSKEGEVKTAFERMNQTRRGQVLDKLIPRLWDNARVENDKQLANAPQAASKDALVMVRQFADDAQRAKIDGYLVDWYAVVSYEKRASQGANTGAAVLRTVGAAGAKRMIDVLNGMISAPGQEKSKIRLDDELLLGVAVTGTPEGVAKLLEVAKMDRNDPSLAKRALVALYTAYVNPGNLEFPVQASEPLAPNLDALVQLAKNDQIDGKATDAALELIRTIGMPRCLDPLLGIVSAPHRISWFKYVVAGHALRCGGIPSIGRVIEALPPEGTYAQRHLLDNVCREIAKLSPRAKVLEELRKLLDARSTLGRWTAIETLAFMKSSDDKARIAALSTAKDRLVGFWGEEEGKPDPTLGDRAKELAAGLP